MSNKRSHCGNAYGVVRGRGYQSLIAIILALSVVVTLVVAEVNTKNKSDKASTEVSVMSLSASSPSKEYIYAGARLIATQEPGGGQGTGNGGFDFGNDHKSDISIFARAVTVVIGRNNYVSIHPPSHYGLGVVRIKNPPGSGAWTERSCISAQQWHLVGYQEYGRDYLSAICRD